MKPLFQLSQSLRHGAPSALARSLLLTSRCERVAERTLLPIASLPSLRWLRDQRRSLSDATPPPPSRPGLAPSPGSRALCLFLDQFVCFCLILFSASRALPAADSPRDSSFFAEPAAACGRFCLSAAARDAPESVALSVRNSLRAPLEPRQLVHLIQSQPHFSKEFQQSLELVHICMHAHAQAIET